MEPPQEIELRTTADDKQADPHRDASENSAGRQMGLPKLVEYKWWIRITIYTLFLLTGQSAATLLGRLYYDKGGNSKWMATFVQSAGFPILLPSYSSSHHQPTDNMMYSYGLLYLPVSTYSLLCGTQLAFNALFSFFLNSQKFTPFILNSLVLLTISASLLAVNADSENTTKISKGKYVIGFLCTVGASATYSLYLSLVQLSSKSGEWKSLKKEMNDFTQGKVSYTMTLLWTAITWQISSVGMLGLIFEVSSLFSNVISTLALPVVPILAVMFFHDKVNGVKVVALVLAVWGFVSYIYQHYLDDRKCKAAEEKASSNEISEVQVC
ncbi:hypothetical protein FNV43_RR10234 [Rhamnella rubrinervis]|uniref:Probable purine permease n=1 Tax=Rhamnella rubrinervis TaxID=2594499 RepID=A0A8K0HBE7_9ROSA|nr:hypothetical protein FNV43_RR10234 [Rhamnella rubrinervis]